MSFENPLMLALLLAGFALGLLVGWLCGVTWMARAMLRRDAHVLDQAAEQKLPNLVAKLRQTRIAP